MTLPAIQPKQCQIQGTVWSMLQAGTRWAIRSILLFSMVKKKLTPDNKTLLLFPHWTLASQQSALRSTGSFTIQLGQIQHTVAPHKKPFESIEGVALRTALILHLSSEFQRLERCSQIPLSDRGLYWFLAWLNSLQFLESVWCQKLFGSAYPNCPLLHLDRTVISPPSSPYAQVKSSVFVQQLFSPCSPFWFHFS